MEHRRPLALLRMADTNGPQGALAAAPIPHLPIITNGPQGAPAAAPIPHPLIPSSRMGHRVRPPLHPILPSRPPLHPIPPLFRV